jgi:hypothetical protein
MHEAVDEQRRFAGACAGSHNHTALKGADGALAVGQID